MNHDNKLIEYSERILQAKLEKSESVLGKIADQFEDDLLDFSDFPEDYFVFAINLLTEERFYSKPGIWNFMLVLGTEKEKLCEHHYAALSKAIRGYYDRYEDEDLCLAVCDFIARNYPHAQARNLLNDLQKIEKIKNADLRGFAADGLRVLELEIFRSQGLH